MNSNESAAARETATLAGGCFWCLEAAFDQLRGVYGVQSGYAGGHTANPTYQAVCGGDTGHAEVVRITFNPSEITFGDLLDVFFTIHDPTTLNRQGADVGTQYRSAILYESEAQHQAALAAIDRWNAEAVWDGPIVTQVAPLDVFHPAEDYHEDYYNRNSSQPYCQAVIAPKLAKLRAKHAQRLRA